MSQDNLPKKVLAVDNDVSVLNAVKQICEKRQINCMTCDSAQNSIYIFNNNRFDVVFVNCHLEGLSGINLVTKWRHHEVLGKRDVGVILATGSEQKGGEIAGATEVGDVCWIQKPIKEPTLLSLLSKSFMLRHQREKLTEIHEKVLGPMLAKGDKEGLLNVAKTKLTQMGPRGAALAAQVFEQVGEIPDAIHQFEGLHVSAPNNMLYVNELGRLQMMQGNFEQAKEYFERADQIAPNNIKRLRDMARNYLEMDQPDAGVEKYKQILELDLTDSQQKFDLYEELQSFGYDDHAQKLCQETSTPLELIRHYNNKGVMFSKTEAYVDAIDEYKKAQRLIPKSKELYRILYNEALAHINLKHPEHLEIALELLHKCVSLKSDYEKAHDKIEKLAKIGFKRKAS